MPAGAVRFRDPAGAAGEKREAFGQAAQPRLNDRLPYRRISSGELDRARRRKEQKQEQSDEREEKEVATPCSGTTRSTMTPMTTLEDSEKEEEEEKEVSAALSEQKTKKRAPLKRSSSQHLGNMDDSALPDFDIYPEYLRIGPWSPVAYVYLACIFAWLLWSSTEALESGTIAPGRGPWVALVIRPISITRSVGGMSEYQQIVDHTGVGEQTTLRSYDACFCALDQSCGSHLRLRSDRGQATCGRRHPSCLRGLLRRSANTAQ
ncbi:unnamed protein product [Prorocentrum cordatum]|uniref:Transmembrane protein n=1 Tax=Prorocentrum cordatum TaxID=2364126 RepID=A0ABN9QPX4_9DINO|nr:unnamed protein product [Polarella glacialis]